jgi:hypothetical protein
VPANQPGRHDDVLRPGVLPGDELVQDAHGLGGRLLERQMDGGQRRVGPEP